jgi:chloramphenicol-sensitive protein RarD
MTEALHRRRERVTVGCGRRGIELRSPPARRDSPGSAIPRDRAAPRIVARPAVCYSGAVNETRRGFVYGIAAYGVWGAVPLYWKLMREVSPVELIAHRVVWGLLACAVIVAATGAGPAVRTAFADRRTVAVMALSGTLLAINWGTFVGAVVTGHIVEASLGYFINPLLSVLLGTLVLRERPRRLQWIAIGFAAMGVAALTWRAGHVPWISLVLASSFAVYGLVRKLARVESLPGATVETALLAPIAVAYLVVLAVRGGGQLGHASSGLQLLVLSTGVVTAIPLLLFSSAARRLPLSSIGFLQFVAPNVQIAIAVTVYGEPFAGDQLIAFGLIWIGLIAFLVDLTQGSRRSRALRALRAAQPNRPVM